jgi:hypothetical protein
VTKHLKVLEKGGSYARAQAQWRPCQLNGELLREAVDWMGAVPHRPGRTADRLGAYLKTKTEGAGHGRRK